MKTVVLIGVITLTSGGSLWAQDPERKPVEGGITKGGIVKGSTSPDGRYALIEYHFIPEETKTRIGIKPVDRSRLLCEVDSRTKWMTDREVPTFLDFLWSADSTLLATHDSLVRHSYLSMYQVAQGTAKALAVPDLLVVACKRLGISKSKVASSGQVPVKWTTNKRLNVRVRLKLKSGKAASAVLSVVVEKEKVAVAK